jgi:hypothetical protein
LRLERMLREHPRRAAILLLLLAIAMPLAWQFVAICLVHYHHVGLPSELLVFLVIAGGALWLHGRRAWLSSVEIDTRGDQRAFVLLLRSFDADHSGDLVSPHLAENFFGFSHEVNLVAYLSALGPVVALGRPGENLPPLGAIRTYVDDANWQAVVLRQLDMCSVAVLQIGQSPGLLWEAEECARRLSPSQVLIVAGSDPRSHAERLKAQIAYSAVRDRMARTGLCLPPLEDPGRQYVTFNPDRTPHVLDFRRGTRILAFHSAMKEFVRRHDSTLDLGLLRCVWRGSPLVGYFAVVLLLLVVMAALSAL